VRRLLLLLVFALIPATGAAQSSQFGVRGLGLPGRAQSVRAMGSAGAFSMFDPQSSVSPTSLVYLPSLTATFTVMSDYRSATNPGGTTSLRDTHFPQFAIGGPIPRTPLTVGLSYSNYTTRDYSLVFPATVVLRDVPVQVTDTIESRGGINDLQLATAYRLNRNWAVGAAAHIITGSNRLDIARVFSDTNYLPARQRAELSFSGFGVSIGIIGQLGRTLTLTAMARSDGHVSIQEDSLAIRGQVDLPITVGGGLRWRPAAKLQLAGQILASNWSTGNEDIVAAGGVGANNTIQVAGGFEFTPHPRRPGRTPLRLGFHWGKLPFPLTSGAEVKEYGVSAGSGYTFGADRAGIDLAVERVWRKQDEQYNEKAWLVSVGVTVRP
jgi:hypothetical protein